MQQVMVIGCGAYIDSGYGCPGEWRCLKAASLGEGTFQVASQVIAFVKCECPGRALVPNLGVAMRMSEINPEKIYLSSCLANAKPGCPYFSPEEVAAIIEKQFGIEVVKGTHEYH